MDEKNANEFVLWSIYVWEYPIGRRNISLCVQINRQLTRVNERILHDVNHCIRQWANVKWSVKCRYEERTKKLWITFSNAHRREDRKKKSAAPSSGRLKSACLHHSQSIDTAARATKNPTTIDYKANRYTTRKWYLIDHDFIVDLSVCMCDNSFVL